jgi:hypothetical protein
MNQIDTILKYFEKNYYYMDLVYLWDCCDSEVDKEDYPDVTFEYDPDTAFFMVLERLLKSGDHCLIYNLNSEDPSRDGERLTCSPDEQLALLKEVWIGKEKMDQLDEENGYLGWYFLNIIPYSVIHKKYNENGNFLKWFLN